MAASTRCAPELQNLEIWHQYESQLRELYLVKNQSLKQVKKSMEEQHGWPVFKLVTYEVVLRDELKLVKNLTKNDWHAIQHHMEKRSRTSKRSEVVFHHHVVDQKRINKAIRRYHRSVNINRVRSPVLRDGLHIRTPPPFSPRTLTPDDMAYIEMAMMGEPSSNIMNAVSPTLPGDKQTVSPRARSGPLSIQAILDIRANAPFNQFAMKLQDIWLSSTLPMGFSTGYLPRPATVTITARNIQQTDHEPTELEVLGISDGSSRNAMTQPTSFSGTDDYFGILMRACYEFSNEIYDPDVRLEFLDWVGLVAEMKLLRLFFALKLPTVIAVWNESIQESFFLRHGKAFNILVDIGLSVDNGRLMQSNHAKYFAMAIDLGYSNASASVHRLLEAGVSPNARFNRSSFHVKMYGIDYHLRCCALKQAAKNRDAEMLEMLITACNCRCGKFDKMYGNLLLRQVAVKYPMNGRPSCLRCVEVLTNSGMRVDFLPEASETLAFTTNSLGWHIPGKPELLVDRVLLSDEEYSREIYKVLARKSQWAQKCVTVSGIFLAAHGGPAEVQRYLDSMLTPEPAMKEVLLQIALSEAAYRNASAVLVCLLQFGVDPDMNTLMARLPEDEQPEWSPVVRAAAQWNTTIIPILLDHGADFGKFSLFRRVIRSEVEPRSKFLELEKKRSFTIQLLLDGGVCIDVPPADLILAALIPLRPRHRKDTDNGWWMEHIQSFVPDFALCNKLQKHGISFNRGVDGCNTLQIALREGCNFATASYLIHNGVQVHSFPRKRAFKPWAPIKNFGETTMLHDALLYTQADRSKVVNLLLDNGADIYAISSEGLSVLEASLITAEYIYPYSEMRTKNDQKEWMDIFWKLFRLIGPKYAFSLNSKHPPSLNSKHQPLLFQLIALEESDVNILAALVDGIDINTYGSLSGSSLLMRAITYGRTTLVMQLVERGCDVNLRMDSFPRPRQGRRLLTCNTALQAASFSSESLSIIRYLIDKGADVNAPPNKWGFTALQFAAYEGYLGTATVLLEHGADVNAKPGTHSGEKFYGKTHQAVDIAAYCGYLDMVHLLVEAGGLSVHPGVTGLDGALFAAEERQHHGIVEYLQQHTGMQLSDEMRHACKVSSPASLRTTSSSNSRDEDDLYSLKSKSTDGENSCHCQPMPLVRDKDAIGEDCYDLMDETGNGHGEYGSPGAQQILDWIEQTKSAINFN